MKEGEKKHVKNKMNKRELRLTRIFTWKYILWYNTDKSTKIRSVCITINSFIQINKYSFKNKLLLHDYNF